MYATGISRWSRSRTPTPHAPASRCWCSPIRRPPAARTWAITIAPSSNRSSASIRRGWAPRWATSSTTICRCTRRSTRPPHSCRCRGSMCRATTTWTWMPAMTAIRWTAGARSMARTPTRWRRAAPASCSWMTWCMTRRRSRSTSAASARTSSPSWPTTSRACRVTACWCWACTFRCSMPRRAARPSATPTARACSPCSRISRTCWSSVGTATPSSTTTTVRPKAGRAASRCMSTTWARPAVRSGQA